MMKTMKISLLATAALAAVSTLAHADALSELKSALASLTARDVYSQSSVQVPRGYNVNPAADSSAPADAAVEEPFVDLKVTGYIKTGFIYSQVKTNGDDKTDFDVEGGVNVKGSVQSALGEVGATIQAKWDIAEASTNAATFALRDDGLIGFWQFSDAMKLEMGRGNAGRIENGIDKNTRRLWTFANRRIRAENAGNGFFDRDAYNAFMGLAYASGPIALQVRFHDATRGIGTALTADDDALGVSAKAVYAGEVVGFEVSGGYWSEDGAVNLAPVGNQTGVKFLAGAGTELNFIDGVPLSFSAQYGELHNGTQSLKLSGSVGFTITDTIGAGFGGGWTRISNTPATQTINSPNDTRGDREEIAAVAGVYYSPMTYLTLGLEGDWIDDSRPLISDGLTGAFVARYAF